MTKKKKHGDKPDKKSKAKSKGASTAKAAKSLKAISQNPIVADVVAAALVSMAAALRDSNKAKQLAASASDEIGKLSSARAKKGNVFWDLALEVGRESLKALNREDAAKRSKSTKRSH
jgi:hypothetical protein